MTISVSKCLLPTADGVVCGVQIEPFGAVRRLDTGQSVSLEDAENTLLEGNSDAPFQLRMRWYRSTYPRGGAVCSVHPEKEASLQCLVCLRCKVPTHLSYHCSVDCLKSHWNLHKDYHKQQPAQVNGESNGYESLTKNSSITDSWIEVGKGRTYTPSQEDVGYTLKFELYIVDRNHNVVPDPKGVVPISLYTSRVRPTPNPPQRALVRLVPPSAMQLHSERRFTVLSYNLLADLYAKADFAKYCPAWSLHWNYRKRNMLREMLAYKADILCLQEVQSDHFQEFWSPELQKAGYVPIYKKKTAEIYTDNKYAIDGCATFFRRDRFQLVKKYEVEFNKAALSLAESFTTPTQKSQALNRLLKDNVALIAVLEAIEPGPPEAHGRRTLICVANTHIHANPELNDVKLWQVHTLLKGLEKIAASADIPMLVAGDFNSTPGSPAHMLLVKGRVEPSQVQHIDPLGFLKDQKLMHSLPLHSAYASMHDANGSVDSRLQKQKQRLDPIMHEPLFTNATRDFKGTLDYILYTSNSLQPTAVLELPADPDVFSKPDEQLPNAQYSSDHVALLTEFQYIRL
ncbi:phosphatase family [Dunaliella salina]|uniref:Phosphatase family n=1 Tax=Dunaliella salina TaxID=3046 RepID=A0ABQ7GPN3_DUNSA|nr:phosphatase family [Dunaliella salina]|eukprot:KAF5836569.1 phosphatase family [Dunaliella salina]